MLVNLATPDINIPYNVIIMSCTLIALIFGCVFNLLTRHFVVVQVDADAYPAPEKPAAVAEDGAEDGVPR